MHYKRRHCRDCNANIKAEAKGPNHILHFLLSLITGGLWIFVWIAASLSRNYTCSDCGGAKLSGVKSEAQRRQMAKAGGFPASGVLFGVVGWACLIVIAVMNV